MDNLPTLLPLNLSNTLLLLLLILLAISPTLRRVISLLIRFAIAFALIQFERKIYCGFFHYRLSLPRDLDEVMASPDLFFALLTQYNVVPKPCAFLSIQRHSSIKSEPSKNKTAGSIKIDYLHNNQPASLTVFCKFQTGRGMPIWLQALRQAAEPNVCREVDFYSKIQPQLDGVVQTPRPLLTAKLPWLNYVLIVLEYIDLDHSAARVVNDGDGASLDEVCAMMRDVAQLHVKFASLPEAVRWIPARRGLEFAQFVDSFLNKQDQVWSLQVWRALQKRFRDSPVTLVHGDCRPGNMMFTPQGQVLFADWEAVNIAPFMWDLTYCTILGWPASARRRHQADVVRLYLAAGPPVAEALADVQALTLVLAFVSRVVRLNGFWSQQGNTSRDQRAWYIRVLLAVADLDGPALAQRLQLDARTMAAIQDDCKQQAEGLCSEGRTCEEI